MPGVDDERRRDSSADSVTGESQVGSSSDEQPTVESLASDSRSDDSPSVEKIPTDGDDQSAIEGNVFGSLSSDTEIIEPGDPSAENTLFVLLGVVLGLLLFGQFYLLSAGLP